jgi:uncharacterized protein YidB (DUF937 family)
MSLFDSLQNQALTTLLSNNSSPLVTGVLKMIQSHPGGLQGLVKSFQEKGMGDLVSAWVSTGPNPPATTDQVNEVLGNDKVEQMAAEAGVSRDTATSAIAQLLPTVVDKLTPDGHVPEHGNVLEMASRILQHLGQAKAS